MSNTNTSTRKSISALTLTGLIIAGLALLIIVLAVAGGGSVTAWTSGALLVGVLIAVIGFARNR
jgi:hypothetical protein